MTPIPGVLPALLLMTPREGGGTGIIFVVQIVLMVVIFWFLLIRPQQKEQKRHQELLASIKRGDEVVTNGGLMGRVDKVQEDRLTVTTGDKTRVTVQRSRIATVLGRDGEPKEGGE